MLKVKDLKAKFENISNFKVTAFSIFAGLSGVSGILLVILTFKLFLSSAIETEKASEQSQRIIYDTVAEKFVLPVKEKPAEHAENPKEEVPKKEEPSSTAEPVTNVEQPATTTEPTTTTQVPPTEPVQQKPIVALVITGVGISKSSTEATNNLPSGISLAISPYSYYTEAITERAKKIGRTWLVEVPMQPKNYPISDPGPYALLCKNEVIENLSRLEWSLARVKDSFGVMIPIEEQFSECSEQSKVIFTKLAEKNLNVVLGNPEQSNTLPESIRISNVKALRNNIVIDSVIDSAIIDSKLLELEEMAKKNGYAIGIARPYPISFKAVSKWVENLNDRGVQLVPISEIPTTVRTEPVPEVTPELAPGSTPEATPTGEPKQ